MDLRPHDLVKIRSVDCLLKGSHFPGWAIDFLTGTPYVVVRRSKQDNHFIPVGIRGNQRGQRHASWLAIENIVEVITPEQLTKPTNWKIKAEGVFSPQIGSLLELTPLLDQFGYEWGPAGSLAFELATGIKTTNRDSDLDLIIRIAEPVSVIKAKTLLTELESLSLCRLDIQINSPLGGFSLKEYCQSSSVLIKTEDRPVLIQSEKIWAA